MDKPDNNCSTKDKQIDVKSLDIAWHPKRPSKPANINPTNKSETSRSTK